jgi:hypothetical protein
MFLIFVYSAHMSKIYDTDFWLRLENQILLRISLNQNWDLKDVTELADSLQEYK